MKYIVAYRPVRRPKDRPYVGMIDAEPRPITFARYETADEAVDACLRLKRPWDEVIELIPTKKDDD